MLTLLQSYLFTGVTGNVAYDIVVKFWRQTFGKDLQDLFLDAFEQVLDGQRSALRRYGEAAELDRETLRRALRGDLDVNRASWSDLEQDEFVRRLAQEMHQRQALTIGGHNLSPDEYQGLLRRLVQGAVANLRRKVLENETAFNHVLLAETSGNRQQLHAVRAYLAERLDLSLQKLEQIEAQTRPVPKILEQVQTQGQLLQQVADDVQALRPLPPTPPSAHVRSDAESAPGASSRARLEQRRREHQTRWDTLGGRILALQKDLDQEIDGERRRTLESRLADRRVERDQVEAALYEIERRLE